MSKNTFFGTDNSDRGPVSHFGVQLDDESHGVEDPMPYEQPVTADAPKDAPGQKAGPDSFFPAEPMQYETDMGGTYDSMETMAQDMLMPEAAQASYEPGTDQEEAEAIAMQSLDQSTLAGRAHQLLMELDPQEPGREAPGQESEAVRDSGVADVSASLGLSGFGSGAYLAVGVGLLAAATLLAVAKAKTRGP